METRKEMSSWAVNLWNQTIPPGTDVILTDDFGEEHKTKTRSPAHQLGCGTPVVQVEGRSGGYLLWRIRPVTSVAAKKDDQ
jgi:hypothetical protein